jgi:hypothetical protein
MTYNSLRIKKDGHSIAQPINRGRLITQALVQSQSSHVGFMVDKEAEGQVFLQVIWFSPVITPPLPHIHTSFMHLSHDIILTTNTTTK